MENLAGPHTEETSRLLAMIELRPHQVEAVDQLRKSLRNGKIRPLLAAPCSMGKTMITSCSVQPLRASEAYFFATE